MGARPKMASSTAAAGSRPSWKSRFANRRLSGNNSSSKNSDSSSLESSSRDLEQSLSNGSNSKRRNNGAKKKIMRLRHLLPMNKHNNNNPELTTKEDYESDTAQQQQQQRQINHRNSPSNPQSPNTSSDATSRASNVMVMDQKEKKESLFQWQDDMEKKEQREIMTKKQEMKERDGFCRRVDSYDGQVVTVDGKPTYELGNYLGGGVAGVVYEGHRLRPMEEYPVRTGQQAVESSPSIVDSVAAAASSQQQEPPTTRSSIFCGSTLMDDDVCGAMLLEERKSSSGPPEPESVPSILQEFAERRPSTSPSRRHTAGTIAEDVAIEATTEKEERVIMVDGMDAPSRSKHFARAARVDNAAANHQQGGLSDETVAVKILNPVGFRLLTPGAARTAVVVKKGEPMEDEVKSGYKPMEERHVWWMVNPNSRNLRTLQRFNTPQHRGTDGNPNNNPRRKIERGSPERGLRISLLAGYVDPKTNEVRELPLTRCIEIWGHIPFSASDTEFEDMISAIEKVNAGHPPVSLPVLPPTPEDFPPSRVGTATSSTGSTVLSMDDLKLTTSITPAVAMITARTGLYRAASSSRATVYCESLGAYIAIPAVPSKYLRWLRQRRAATKEIRNMMHIGRHKNVVHLFEVLEHIQEAKSTMFLILELVRGGELFDLISSNTNRSKDGSNTEVMMKKFFRELASGVHYCHANGIAHRDLKPENLLVHNDPSGDCTLKIADFGLSAAFGHQHHQISDHDTVVDSIASPSAADDNRSYTSTAGRINTSWQLQQQQQITGSSSSPIKESMDKILATGVNALSYLTCGAMEDILCAPNTTFEEEQPPSPLRRMTSVVGSPHYVAPEVISQHDDLKSRRRTPNPGYDGTKADVWSAGVILYAMLFRSLPFGEDLLRCPRYQSYRKWYNEAKNRGGRRAGASAALNPVITEQDEHDMLGPHWFFPSVTTKESRDLIVAMLNPDPDERLTVQMVLLHPWLASSLSS